MSIHKKKQKARKENAQKSVWVRSERALATALGLSARTIKGYRLKEGAPIADGSGRYNLDEWKKWLKVHGKEAATDAPTREDWDIRIKQNQVEKLEFDLKVKKGEMLAKDDVNRWVEEIVLAAKTTLLAMPSRLAPDVVCVSIAEAEKRIREAVIECLNKLQRRPWGEIKAE